MSVSDKEISNVGFGVSGVKGDDDDESGVHRRVDHHDDEQRRNQKRVKGHCFCGFSLSTRLGKRAKGFVLNPLKRNRSKSTKKTHVINEGSSSNCSGNFSNSGNNGCYFCFTRGSIGESVPVNGSQTSDPNDPNFTYDMLRVLIERNDFCSKDCNTHLDSHHCGD